MKTIPAQEIKKRGISAVDDMLKEGDVHVIKNNRPQYVVISEDRYQELLATLNEAFVERVRQALKEVKSGHVKKFRDSAELLKSIEAESD